MSETNNNSTDEQPPPPAKTDADPNSTIMKVWKEQGAQAAVAEMFKHPETKKPLTYSEMRGFFG